MLLTLLGRFRKGAEVGFDGVTMAGGHAVREVLQSLLLRAGREVAPVLDQALELLLVHDAGALSSRIGDITTGSAWLGETIRLT